MTFEELKAEAERQGYYLMKKPTYIPKKPCVCGAKRSVRMFYTNKGKGFYCNKCKLGLNEQVAKTDKQAQINWNKLVEELCKEKSL